MKFDKFNVVKKQLRDSKAIGNIEERYNREIKTPGCDKHQLKFNGDDRFTIFKATVRLCGYTGYYGNSSCSTLESSIDDSFASDLLNKVLNKNLSFILSEMAKLGIEEANKSIDDAKKELTLALESLDLEINKG